jgi:hypothetical protein
MRFTWRLLYCLFGKHNPGYWRDAFPNRCIRICRNCGKITEEAAGPLIEKSGRLSRKP